MNPYQNRFIISFSFIWTSCANWSSFAAASATSACFLSLSLLFSAISFLNLICCSNSCALSSFLLISRFSESFNSFSSCFDLSFDSLCFKDFCFSDSKIDLVEDKLCWIVFDSFSRAIFSCFILCKTCSYESLLIISSSILIFAISIAVSSLEILLENEKSSALPVFTTTVSFSRSFFKFSSCIRLLSFSLLSSSYFFLIITSWREISFISSSLWVEVTFSDWLNMLDSG
mmetsp:Transcript_30633/g.30257  ORF Transcript_30633/g.30257 Transcript_30633/m.30257 type:complete len:230 (-) Transcript_30633:87-776(-)